MNCVFLQCSERRRIGLVVRRVGTCMLAMWLAAAWTQASKAQQAGRVGRAVIVGLTPKAVARYPDKTAHDYPQGQLELREGMAGKGSEVSARQEVASRRSPAARVRCLASAWRPRRMSVLTLLSETPSRAAISS